MLISVFTPTHDPRWLDEAYDSLVRQTYLAWEWVVVLNGDAARGDAGRIPARLKDNDKVRLIAAPSFADCGRVGALKRFAASQCKGDVLVELDHDDMLTPRALERVADAVAEGAGFVYSDFIQLRSDGTCETFSPELGWESSRVAIDGRDYEAVSAFPLSAASLAHIWWAPNHVRAWTRAAYDKAGGHDPELKVCDDYDLVCRTYLAGVECTRIPAALYIYRLRKGQARNSFLEHNAEIQRLDQQLSNKYFYQLCDEWARRAGLVTLRDPGVVQLKREAAGLVGVIRAHDLLHRLTPVAAADWMNRAYSVLAPGGWLQLRVPSSDCALGCGCPTARSYWNRTSWWYYTRRPYADQVPGLGARFQAVRAWDAPISAWEAQQKVFHSHADLLALKGQRTPGLKYI